MDKATPASRTSAAWLEAYFESSAAMAEAWARGDVATAESWATLAEWQHRNMVVTAQGGLRPS